MKGWVLVDRRKSKPVMWRGVWGPTRLDAWDEAFFDVCNELGKEWEVTYWHRPEDSIRSARKHGLCLERAEVVLVKKGKKK